MDNELKQKFAPRRAIRHLRVRNPTEAASWAASLDWKTNDYDFRQLCQCAFDNLDWQYREYGFRVDQLASHDELMRQACFHANFYQQEQFAEFISFYPFLYMNLNVWLGGLANAVLEKRRENAKALAT